MLLQFGKTNYKKDDGYMELFDTHSHYNDEQFNGDREEVIRMIYEEGITNTVVVRR